MNIQSASRAAAGPRPAGLLLVMAVHVALVWLVANGLGVRMTLEPPPPPIQATFEQQAKPRFEPPPLPALTMADPSRAVPPEPPEILLPRDELPPGDARLAAPDDRTGGSAMPEPLREPVRTDPRHPLTQPAYPAASVRFGEEGTVTIELRVGPDGRVREARVQRSSGFPRLDAAALEEARRLWRLLPATVDSSPVEAWHAVRVSFRLDRR